ncbi:MAG: SAM-dependent DNA methyltransferase [Alphaproteobacteria bacterium]
MTIESVEARRIVLQAALDAGKSPAERNRLGQFATPFALARDIVTSSLGMLSPDQPVRFLDPAIGTGAFYSALRATLPAERIAEAAGFEIDPHHGHSTAALWATTPLRLAIADFTTATPPPDGGLATLVVCNPPYVRHHHLSRDDKARLRQAAEEASGIRMAGLAGLYTYFLTLSHAWMADDGVAAWLIPSEFMDVAYGEPVKRYLLSRVTLTRIHRFDPGDVQFGDALVSSAVVWFRRAPPPPGHEVAFTFGGSLATPQVRRKVAARDLVEETKWTRHPLGPPRRSETGPVLGDFFRIQRGLATGDNRFFIMTREAAAARGLPDQVLVPVLPSPRHLPETEIAADLEGHPLITRPLVLLDCRLAEAEVRTRHPALWAYLQSGVPHVSGRYLCAHRTPWYAQETRAAAPFVCTYMGRTGSGGRTGSAPFRFILNRSRATAANVYLLMYPKPQLQAALDAHPGLDRRVWEMLRTIGPEDLMGEGRVYGGGLYKLEPKELARVEGGGIAALLTP